MKLFLQLVLCICYLTVSAQSKNAFYALDANMNQTVLDSSKYILWIHEKEDSNWQWDYYRTWGTLVKSESFADHDGTIQNGRTCIYNTTGNIDSLGVFDHGKKNGSFYKYRTYSIDSVVLLKQYDYISDSLVKMIDFIKDTNQNKDVDTSNSKESEYPGGLASWFAFMQKDLKYPDRALDKDIQGQVKIYFIVNEEGTVKDPYISKSVEYSLDQESIRLIKNSGKWIPGMKNGAPVKTYKLQPINFKLTSQ